MIPDAPHPTSDNYPKDDPLADLQRALSNAEADSRKKLPASSISEAVVRQLQAIASRIHGGVIPRHLQHPAIPLAQSSKPQPPKPAPLPGAIVTFTTNRAMRRRAAAKKQRR
jgi:hypothetical protein